MALSTSNVTAISDSIAANISDFTTCYITNTGISSPSNATIASDVLATFNRVVALNDAVSELGLLSPANTVMSNVTGYNTSLRSINPYYVQWFPLFDALDKTVVYNGTSGLNAFLTGNNIQVNALFASAFNYWCTLATQITIGRTAANAPVTLSVGNYFPYTAIDNMWSFTSSGASTFSANAVGANANTNVAGGGIAQFYIYKSNATAAVGGATFTISYTTAAGGTGTATYSTTSGVPAATGTLSAGYAISAYGSAITGVTGAGMTSGEAYVIGIKLVRTPIA